MIQSSTDGTPALAPTMTMSPVPSFPASPKHTPVQALKLGGSRPSFASHSSSTPSFTSLPTQRVSSFGSIPPPSSNTPSPFMAPLQPNPSSFTTMNSSQPVPPLSGGPQQPSKPNYNITLPMAPIAPAPNPMFTVSSMPPAMSPSIMNNSPMMGTMLTPSKPAQPSWNTNKTSKDDWGDFDPLS